MLEDHQRKNENKKSPPKKERKFREKRTRTLRMVTGGDTRKSRKRHCDNQGGREAGSYSLFLEHDRSWFTVTVSIFCATKSSQLEELTLVELVETKKTHYHLFFETSNLHILGILTVRFQNSTLSSEGTSNSTIHPQGFWTGPGHELVEIELDPAMSLCQSRRWGR